jgi:hypothetical protein
MVAADGKFLDVLRGTALVAALAGSVGSIGLMLRAGNRNPSSLLILRFAFWVLSPFAALVWANALSKRWSALTRAALYVVMLVITFACLGIYAALAFRYLMAKTGFIFLVVPAGSWLLAVAVVPVAALISRRNPVTFQK